MLKYCIAYAGMALRVDFVKVGLPAGDRNLVFQEKSFFLMLSKMYWNPTLLDCGTISVSLSISQRM